MILGGAGFIGRHLAIRLNELSFDVFVVDSLEPQVHVEHLDVAFADAVCELVVADVATYDWLTDDIIGASPYDAVIHLAAETGTSQSMYQAHRYVDTNCSSLAILNDVLVNPGRDLRHNRVPRGVCGSLPESLNPLLTTQHVILASSRAIYGDCVVDDFGVPVPSREFDSPRPNSIYGASKLAQEFLLSTGFPRQSKTVLRFQNVYGAGQTLENPYTGILAVFTRAALAGEPIRLFSDGLMTRDFIHVSDAVNAICLAIASPNDAPLVMNVGTGHRTSVLEIAQAIVRHTNSSSQIVVTHSKLAGDVRHAAADTAIAKAFGFQSSVCVLDGLADFVDWAARRQTTSTSAYSESIGRLQALGLLTPENL